MIFWMSRYSYNQSELILKLTSSLIPRRISHHGQIINHDVRMVHHAARGHAFSAQYDAAVQDPIIAASMRTEFVDLLIPQDDNRGSKVSIARPPARAHIITNTWATKKKYDTNGNFERAKSCVCPHGFRQIPRVDFDPDATEAPTLAIEHGMFLLQLQEIRDMKCAQVDSISI